MTKEQIKTYLIDCVGYRIENLEDKTKSELMDLVDNEANLISYYLN